MMQQFSHVFFFVSIETKITKPECAMLCEMYVMKCIRYEVNKKEKLKYNSRSLSWVDCISKI